ncbi:MAG TPA: hypothetical protein VLV78_00620 [Thermoanaerobaculia bacterium]|nr:hypothetical protein [Thermoanaerobaculia bacterium]
MIKVICTSCQKPLSLDETKLPMKEVGFPCPVCKTKLTVDRRKFTGEQPHPAAVGASAPDGDADEPDNHEDDFGAKAFIVGNDNPAIRQAAKLIGYLPVHYPTAEQARERFTQEPPHVVIMNPQQITPPPLEAMQPIIGVVPSDRRKSFFVLVAENLRTLDGNAAFLYGVNLVVAPKDLGTFPQIFKDAYAHHERLYANMNSVMKVMESA